VEKPRYFEVGPMFPESELPPFCVVDTRDGWWGVWPSLGAIEQAEEAGDVALLQDTLLYNAEVPVQFLKKGTKVLVYDSICALDYYEEGELIWSCR
jgi:hypothetical protein